MLRCSILACPRVSTNCKMEGIAAAIAGVLNLCSLATERTKGFFKVADYAAEQPMVCATLRWRELDSKFQFRATLGGLAGLQDTRSGQSSGSHWSSFLLTAEGNLDSTCG
jgi:hypothetical protein